MRSRRRILDSLEALFRERFEEAVEDGDAAAQRSLDFDYRLEQIRLEVLLDIRQLLDTSPTEADGAAKEPSLLDRAEQLRRITKRP
ncbi:MAG: hypothetical protein EA352_12310 [Gemmatimonadales bacterium]|nr:MAG: hypothetical protein EA352_12310 [Gemmatimonadales bacterium]